MSDPRPCRGSNANVCVAEGCYGEACAREVWRDWPDDAPTTPGDWERVPLASDERARTLALLDDPAVVEAMAHAHYRNQMPDADDWGEGTDGWRDLHRADMQAALDVLRARIEEDT